MVLKANFIRSELNETTCNAKALGFDLKPVMRIL